MSIQIQQQCSKLFATDSFPRSRKSKSSNGRSMNFLQELQMISTSNNWRKAANFIINDGFHCSRSSISIFNNLTSQAFVEADHNLGWQMLAKINDSNLQPNCDSFLAYWDYCTVDHSTFADNVEKMLEFIAQNDIIISKTVIEELTHRIQHFGGASVPTNINYDGICENCQYQMERLQQSELEFQSLKREFEKVLVKPKIISVELGVFRQLVNKKKTFDYIIDALNVTRMFPDSKGNIFKQGQLLARFVEELRAQNKKVFVVGKKHVEDWPEQSINSVRKNATVYLTNHNAAVDDILMIYAALISGPKSHIVTNDLLEEYPEELSKDGQRFFKNWQKQHQHFVTYSKNSDSLQIHKPKRYNCCANKANVDSGKWHIPFTEKPLMSSLKGLIRIPIQWSCVQLRPNN